MFEFKNDLVWMDEGAPVKTEEASQAPAETEEEVVTESAEPDQEPETEPEEEVQQPKKGKSGLQRMREKQAHMLERQAYLEAEVQALRSQQHQIKPELEPTKQISRPKMEDYTSLEEYDAALHEFIKQDTLRELREEQRRQQEAQRIAERDKKLNTAFSEARSRFSDFDDNFEEIQKLPVVRPALTAIEREGAEFLAEMVRDPERYARIAAMDPDEQAYEVALIVASLKNKPAKRVERSKAPEPIAPTKGGKPEVVVNSYRNGLIFR